MLVLLSMIILCSHLKTAVPVNTTSPSSTDADTRALPSTDMTSMDPTIFAATVSESPVVPTSFITMALSPVPVNTTSSATFTMTVNTAVPAVGATVNATISSTMVPSTSVVITTTSIMETTMAIGAGTPIPGDKGDEGKTRGVVIAIAAGGGGAGLTFLVILVIVICCCCHYRKHHYKGADLLPSPTIQARPQGYVSRSREGSLRSNHSRRGSMRSNLSLSGIRDSLRRAGNKEDTKMIITPL